MINYIVTNVDPKFRVFSDLPGHTVSGGGSIPPELGVTTLKPDIVILNDQEKRSTCLSSHVPLRRILRRGTLRKPTNMHISQLTSVITTAKWMRLRCPPKVSLHLEITPHWPSSTSTSTQASNLHFSRRTFLHAH